MMRKLPQIPPKSCVLASEFIAFILEVFRKKKSILFVTANVHTQFVNQSVVTYLENTSIKGMFNKTENDF